MVDSFFADEDIAYPPQFMPAFPGGPGHPLHPAGRRIGYFLIGILLAITTGFGNTLVQDNQGQLLGALGAESTEIAWVPTAYVMSFATMNLLLVRFRQQFGLRLYALLSLGTFSLLVACHTLVRGIGGAILIHAMAGFAAASLLTLSIYYFMEALDPKDTPRAAVFSLALSQVPIPMARLIDPEQLALDDWQSLYSIELSLALLCLVSVLWLRLPPGVRSRAFEPLDLISYPLFAGGVALVIAVIGMGRFEWWTDRAWLGWALAAAVPLLAAGIYIEAYRPRPLFDVRWLLANGILPFGLVVVLLRVTLGEQSQVFGFLTAAGLLNDNLTAFCLALTAAAVAGAITSALVYSPKRIMAMGVAGFTVIAIAAAVDSTTTSLTRAPQFYATQLAMSFATTFAVGPTLVYGAIPVAKARGVTLTTFVVLFAIAQNVGGLGGVSLLGTLQVLYEKANSSVLVDRAPAFDSVVQARIAAGGGGGRGLAALQAAMSHEAGTLAYDNVFATVSVMAALVALYILARALFWPPGATQMPRPAKADA